MQKKVDAIIIGAGLSGLTLAFYLKKAGKSCIILEKGKRCGGVMLTTKKDGFTFETGPNSGVMSSPEMAELFEDLEGKCELEVANEASKQRWIWKKGDWHALPSDFLSAISTPLFTWRDKFRILGEPFRKKGKDPMESLSRMVVRRMGKSYLNYAVNPFISGIYAGDPKLLITKYALPKLYQLEQNYGGFILGSIKNAKTRTERDKKATRQVFTTKGGIQNLIDALSDGVGKDNIILNTGDFEFSPEGNDYSVKINEVNYIASNIISTTEAKSLTNLFPFINRNDLDPVTHLEYAKVVQVVLGYKKWEGRKLNAFGGLIPSIEERDTLGILFPSSIFSDRAPEDGALLTVFMGGVKRADIIDMSDEEIRDIALNEVEVTLNCTIRPDMVEIARYPVAIPQYDASSQWRLEAIKWIEDNYHGIHLAGSIKDGIGMSDRVKQARNLAQKISENA
jgi:oxygen-dependent protoporphyrinogen oxidase